MEEAAAALSVRRISAMNDVRTGMPEGDAAHGMWAVAAMQPPWAMGTAQQGVCAPVLLTCWACTALHLQQQWLTWATPQGEQTART